MKSEEKITANQRQKKRRSKVANRKMLLQMRPTVVQNKSDNDSDSSLNSQQVLTKFCLRNDNKLLFTLCSLSVKNTCRYNAVKSIPKQKTCSYIHLFGFKLLSIFIEKH